MSEPRSRKIDVFALAMLALGVFLIVALVTYHPADLQSNSPAQPTIAQSPFPNVQQSSTVAASVACKIANACGRSGAYAAEGLFRLFGWGAYFLVVSLLGFDLWLLARRPLDDLLLRASGWVMTLLAVTTLLALVGPGVSPGPLIGPGGYLGAAGRAWLEINFATAGAFILSASVLVAGLILCTDYLFILLAYGAARLPVKATAIAASKITNRTPALAKTKSTDVDNVAIPGAGEPAVVIRGKRIENAATEKAAADDEAEEDETETAAAPVVKSSSNSKGANSKADEEESDEADEAETAETDPKAAAENNIKPGLGARLASALRIRNLNKDAEREELLEQLEVAASETDEIIDYEFPSLELLLAGESVHLEEHEKEVRQKAKMLEKTFANFGFQVKVVEIETGPVIAQYEVELEAGLRISKITSLADDLAIALRVPSVRIVAPIPGKNTVGIEVPNNERQLVRLREVIEETNGRAKKMRIPLYLGKDVAGNPMVIDLAALPHLLIAGRTGTGKSVCLNSIIVSMLMTRSPNDVRMLMIDPKMVELSPYKNLPHLMHPVVTDMRKAEAILAWAVEKMEERYALLAKAGVRHISIYNQLGDEELMERLQPENDEERAAIPHHLPYIVIVADEIADLMMTSGKEVEQHIIRLAQKSRAVGIHLILATQKPTVDVITGLIKSNLPARICFQVASRTDSRVVLDEMGADKLLGNGDMLFLMPATSQLLRGQGTFLSDDEINRVLDCVGTTQPQFVTELVQLKPAGAAEGGDAEKFKNRDELYEQAVDVVIREGRGSVSLLQRALGIGYGRAARLIDFMAEDGIVGQYAGSQAREVMVTLEQWAAMCGQSDEPAPPAIAAKPAASANTALTAGGTKPKRNRIMPDPEPADEFEDGLAKETDDDSTDDSVSEEAEDAPWNDSDSATASVDDEEDETEESDTDDAAEDDSDDDSAETLEDVADDSTDSKLDQSAHDDQHREYRSVG
jgi:S-DNA-T family DNA segregation ATPase FtsK/SpoIIIE